MENLSYIATFVLQNILMRHKVYIVDDDLVSQFATLYAIKKIDTKCDIIAFDGAMEALEVIKQDVDARNVQLIIVLDLVMPNVDGWAFLSLLQEHLVTNALVKTYVLSAFRKSADRERAKNHPLITGFFDKPLSLLNAQKILANFME